jgi:hypothetical protein
MDDVDWTDRELRHELKKFGSLKEEHGELVLQVEGKRLLDGKLLLKYTDLELYT